MKTDSERYGSGGGSDRVVVELAPSSQICSDCSDSNIIVHNY